MNKGSTKRTRPLNTKDMTLLVWIHQYISKKGYQPSIREIQKGLDYSSTSTVCYNLRRLQTFGLITRQKMQARTMLITPQGLNSLKAGKTPKQIRMPSRIA